MPQLARLCLYNAATEASLLVPFRQSSAFDIVGEAKTWDELALWLSQSSVDAVAVNLDVPDSLDVVRRTCEASPNCQVIGIFELADSLKILQANRAGCVQFIAKPVDPQDVRNVADLVRARRRTRVLV